MPSAPLSPFVSRALLSLVALAMLVMLASLGFTGCQGYVSGRPAPLAA